MKNACKSVLLVTGLWLASFGTAEAQVVTRACGIGSAGDACIFDITARANGTLTVDTRAAAAGQRWRVAVAVAGANTITSGVGTGSTTSFTGRASISVVSGGRYEVVVFYERPLPSSFPTSVVVRFAGPVTVSAAREGPALPIPDRYVGNTDSTLFFSVLVAPDGRSVAEVRITNHSCLGALTSFIARLQPSVAPVRPGPDGRPRFDARGIPLAFGTFDIEGVFLDADNVGVSTEQALGGLSIVRSLGRCNTRWTATAVALDSDIDGWSDTAEVRLGSPANNRSGTPEHRVVPTTPLRGPDSCHDRIDNDRDGLADSSDPDCAP
jgi:hypothetical protein